MQASHLMERYTALVKEDPHMYRAAESLLSTLSYLATNRFGFSFGHFVMYSRLFLVISVICHVMSTS